MTPSSTILITAEESSVNGSLPVKAFTTATGDTEITDELSAPAGVAYLRVTQPGFDIGRVSIPKTPVGYDIEFLYGASENGKLVGVAADDDLDWEVSCNLIKITVAAGIGAGETLQVWLATYE